MSTATTIPDSPRRSRATTSDATRDFSIKDRQLLAAQLRRSNIDASAGAVEEVARMVGHIRTRWPRVRILLRADAGFARDELMDWCELNSVDFLFGLAKNARLTDAIAAELDAARRHSERAGRPARRFKCKSLDLI